MVVSNTKQREDGVEVGVVAYIRNKKKFYTHNTTLQD